MLLTNNLGYPRVGAFRELKKANEAYWAKKISAEELLQAGLKIRESNWKTQKDAGIELIPSNDFSFYDQVLDLSLTVGAIPARYNSLLNKIDRQYNLDLYFAMARGFQEGGVDVTAMEMTKWFDTNYHYIVPEFVKNQEFKLTSEKFLSEYNEAKQSGIETKPVLIGPITYLLLGKEKEADFNRIDLIDRLLPVYEEILAKLADAGAKYVQIDEPFLALDIDDATKALYGKVFEKLAAAAKGIKLIVATYFEALGNNEDIAVNLPVHALHLDLVRGENQLDTILSKVPASLTLSLGVVEGRNIWKNDYENSLKKIKQAVDALGKDRVWVAPSSSLLHVPFDLDNENNEESLPAEVKNWLAFAKQKLAEVKDLAVLAEGEVDAETQKRFEANKEAAESRRTSPLIHRPEVKNRVSNITDEDAKRTSTFNARKEAQQAKFNLPGFATTTIGSFPQTKDVRKWRADLKKGAISQEEYDKEIAAETERTIRLQEDLDIDVLVHGEFERNDMVEYFGEQLAGYAFTQNGWVQSYGSRCVKPPIIFGDVYRPEDMTVRWSAYAQSLTNRPVKGMLTGPVTILQWSFVRNDQPRSTTTYQIALAILDEVQALEKAGIKIIQIDEPAIREGLPLRKADQQEYLDWAVRAFRVSSSNVDDDTQIHTHMCYSEFNDIIQDIAAMDADVITIETSRSQMELLDAFADFKYPNDIGPGVYDIHSPRVPSTEEMVNLLRKAKAVVPAEQLWVNPDCGLKTRAWPETKAALESMVEAAKILRAE
ncbi:5-methyltetrahydropteroyltriglutamate--homocysteine methyltransferase [Sphingobacterium mizutaii NBRC 14946 = DSM 11724]|uniref:5-methyltetrahydropteroyltriglutamate--homocysteine methyltransferase n=2 Tax=Sphingobacterium mizutaii TaxID=1010 RepID=A0AAJ4XG05_9SPHI|nr:5-methyltetrahydropteroyltriglutamate--homocysteine S-methyltransferase [Sphingobacterium mizutaii]GEM68957.1 5-methyltetrahydropteroyltriglutamate--homocysteine methyltransferase [Sphingobacterium mizutaii NBRC 14946 = DSM 11724]SDL68608.1 methionine synthase (B12-independent) [Sphingobacterium mizutaii]SNV58231.1 5-methyltetrahydropteroyltriglutamate--homocysteine methyltransferase [Sphingobacterium mizutaii]